jgi:hypothetical protein
MALENHHGLVDFLSDLPRRFGGLLIVVLLRRVFRPAGQGGRMEKEIKIGTEGGVDVKLSGGFVTLEAKYAGVEAQAGLSVSISVDKLLDKLAAAVPGQIDDAVIAVVKAALKVV